MEAGQARALQHRGTRRTGGQGQEWNAEWGRNKEWDEGDEQMESEC